MRLVQEKNKFVREERWGKWLFGWKKKGAGLILKHRLFRRSGGGGETQGQGKGKWAKR